MVGTYGVWELGKERKKVIIERGK